MLPSSQQVYAPSQTYINDVGELAARSGTICRPTRSIFSLYQNAKGYSTAHAVGDRTRMRSAPVSYYATQNELSPQKVC